jgi:quercetin dioxygenase-like cupin family protein
VKINRQIIAFGAGDRIFWAPGNGSIPSEGEQPGLRVAPVLEEPTVPAGTFRLYRWDEIALDKITEMVSRKFVSGERETLAQIYLKRGAIVPMHSHESEQMTYVLQGALKFLVAGEEITLREGEVLHIPSRVPHQAEALEDTFELDIFSPIRQDWLDHTDDYLRQ